MYKYFLTVMVVITCCHTKAQDTPDVRKVVWGMTKEEVRNSEKLEEIRMDLPSLTKDLFNDVNEPVSYIVYQTTVAGLDAILAYAFVADELQLMTYLFNEVYASYSSYRQYALVYSDFKRVNDSLYTKYGPWKSDSDSDPQQSDLYRKAGMNALEMLLLEGRYHRTVEWRTPRTVILHGISSDGNVTSHGILYESIDSYRARQKSTQDDL